MWFFLGKGSQNCSSRNYNLQQERKSSQLGRCASNRSTFKKIKNKHLPPRSSGFCAFVTSSEVPSTDPGLLAWAVQIISGGINYCFCQSSGYKIAQILNDLSQNVRFFTELHTPCYDRNTCVLQQEHCSFMLKIRNRFLKRSINIFPNFHF